MKTQQELKDKINKIGEEIRSLQAAHWNDQEYKELIKKAAQVREQIEKRTEKEIGKLYSEKQKLEKELKERKLSKKIQLSVYLSDWLQQYMRGINWGYKLPLITWHSEDERFVILTHPGQTSGTGTVMGSMGYYYSPSDHILIDTKRDDRETSYGKGKLGFKIGDRVEGRLTKEKKQMLLNQLEKYTYDAD